MWILWVILCVMVLGLLLLGWAILAKQEKLDKPCKGILMIDTRDPDGVMVYATLGQPPETFTDGEEIKMVVRRFKER